MKRNRFRLATVMRVRRIQEDIELARLSQARAGVQAAGVEETRRSTAYTDAVRVTSPAMNARHFLNQRSTFDRLGDQVIAARQRLAETHDEERLRRDDWSVAAQRVSALTRLFDRHLESHQAGLRAEDVLDSDERTMQRRLHTRRAPGVQPPPHRPVPPTGAVTGSRPTGDHPTRTADEGAPVSFPSTHASSAAEFR